MSTSGEVKLSTFFGIAIVEHLVLILVLAMAAYTKPVPKVHDTAITVDILINQPEQKRREEEIPIALPPTLRPEILTELPPLQAAHDVQRYLNPGGPSGGLPSRALARTTKPRSKPFSVRGSTCKGTKPTPDRRFRSAECKQGAGQTTS